MTVQKGTQPPNIFSIRLQAGQRLDQAIAEQVPDLSRSRAQKFIRNGHATLDGKAITRPALTVTEPATFSFVMPVEIATEIVPNNLNVPIVYQDDDLAIVHKPAGMTVHPGAGTTDDTLVHSLAAQLPELAEVDDPTRPGIVHRLDRKTEGLMVVAKRPQAHAALGELFAQRKVYKEYAAFCWGDAPDQGELQGFIGRDPRNRKRMQFTDTAVHGGCKQAALTFKCKEQISPFSRVMIELQTGRTHQIRASFAAKLGPVVGDDMYGDVARLVREHSIKTKNFKKEIESLGLLLYAQRLRFKHPSSGEQLDFHIPLPERFDRFSALIQSS